MEEFSQVRYWIENLPKKGITTFSLIEAEKYFSEKPASSVRRALARLAKAGKIHSVWKGFYAIALPEYGTARIIPPMDYIDQLMRYLEKRYYVALLTAASLHGAAHQAPQTFHVICNSILNKQGKADIKIEMAHKKVVPNKYISAMNSRTASVKVSTPELTALDLVTYMHRVGGINNVASVLAELAESINYDKTDCDILGNVPRATVQRLGYLLDEILEEKETAENLYNKAKIAAMRFKAVPLVAGKTENQLNPTKNKKWNVIVNYEVESDL